MSLDLAEEMCYTGENDSAGDIPGYAETAGTQCDGTGSSGTADGFPAILSCWILKFSIEEACGRAPEESRAGIIRHWGTLLPNASDDDLTILIR